LLDSLPDGPQLVYCRGTDVGVLLALGVVDIGLTGYDMIAEAVASGRPPPFIWSLAPARTSYVCLLKPEQRTTIKRVYTEYPHLARAWLNRSRVFSEADVVTLHGSIEGVVALDDQSAGVLLVTSGETAKANGLDVCLPLLVTDLCLVAYAQPPSPSGILCGLDIGSLPTLELPEFCRVSALHGPVPHPLPRARATHAVTPAGEDWTATGPALWPPAG
jgi:ATP phosphoribosyltransferase